MKTTSIRIPNSPAAIFAIAGSIDPAFDVVIHGIADTNDVGHGHMVTNHPGELDLPLGVELCPHGLQPASSNAASRPTDLLMITIAGMCRLHTLAADLRDHLRAHQLNAVRVFYHRINPQELDICEHAVILFHQTDAEKVHALAVHYRARGYAVHLYSAVQLGTQGHLFIPSHSALDRHVLHTHAAPGIANHLNRLAHKHGVRLAEIRGLESVFGAVILLGFDGLAQNRHGFIDAVKHLVHPHVPAPESAPSPSFGDIWIEASGPSGTVIKVLGYTTRRGLSFAHVQTGDEHHTDILQGVLACGHRSPWAEALRLEAWAKQNRIRLTYRVLVPHSGPVSGAITMPHSLPPPETDTPGRAAA